MVAYKRRREHLSLSGTNVQRAMPSSAEVLAKKLIVFMHGGGRGDLGFTNGGGRSHLIENTIGLLLVRAVGNVLTNFHGELCELG